MDVLKLTLPLVLVLRSCAATKLHDCPTVHSVHCKNGTVMFELDPNIQQKHMGCEAGIYDKDGHFLCDVDTSTLLKHRNVTIDFCLSEFRLKLQCPNKMNNVQSCFRVVNDTSYDPPALQKSDGVSRLQLLILIPVAVIVAVIVAAIGVAIRIRKMKRQREGQLRQQRVSFSKVNQIEPD